MGDLAISCRGVWKSYRVYHQRSHTLKEKVLARRSRYEEFWALRGIDLEVPRGSTLGVIGANGSGKSTLLKTMSRILTPNKGSVVLNGSVASLLELGTGFHPELTGRENIYLGSAFLGRSRREVDASFDSIVEFSGVGQFIDTPTKNYSTGMYARLAFSVAVSVEPEILLIDEVLSVGDESFQIRCQERISELRANGCTIVLVTHGLEAVRTLCQQAAWIDKGVLRRTGSAHDVISSYLAEVHGTVSSSGGEEPMGARFGTGEATVTRVAFIDGHGERRDAFQTGETLTIRVEYQAHTLLDDLSCAIAVYRDDTMAYVFGQSTKAAGVDLSPSGVATVELSIPNLPLLQGRYVITLALHDRNSKDIYDFHDRGYAFVVLTNPDLPEEAGTIRVASEWRASPSPVAV